jgi:hypothetical protein
MLRLIKGNGRYLLCFVFLLFCLQCSNKNSDGAGTTTTTTTTTPPVLSTISPAQDIVGDPITIQGTALDKADNVYFGTTTSKIVQNNSTSVTTVVPQGVSPGTLSVTVHTPGGTSNGLSFEVLKTPDHIDSLPPVIAKTIPSGNFNNYPLLIYGNNLGGVIKLTFNDKDATIFTNNDNVVTTTVPQNLPAGSVTIKLYTVKGTSTTSFQVSGPPPAPGAAVNFSIVNIPPPNYIPNISNQWGCGLFSAINASMFLVNPNFDGVTPTSTIAGKYKYHYNQAQNYNDENYIEYTDSVNKETFAGMFSSKTAHPCILSMILISSKTGTVSNCTFDFHSSFPDQPCDP